MNFVIVTGPDLVRFLAAELTRNAKIDTFFCSFVLTGAVREVKIVDIKYFLYLLKINNYTPVLVKSTHNHETKVN